MKWALPLVLLLSVTASFGIGQVEPQVDFVDTVPRHEGLEPYRALLRELDGTRFAAIYMAHDPSSGTDSLRGDGFDALVAEQQNLTTHLLQEFPDHISHSLSVYEAMRQTNYMVEKIATAGNPRPESYSFPDDPVRYELVKQQLGDSINDVLAADGSSAIMLFFLLEKDDLLARNLVGDIDQTVTTWVAGQDQLVTTSHASTGLLWASHYTDERNGHDLRLWGAVAAGAVAAVLLVVLRRPSLVLLAASSTAIATVWTFGLMGLLGIRISFLTLFLAPLISGVTVDYAVHLLHRVDQENGPRQQRIATAIKSTGQAVAIAAVTTSLGLATMLFLPSPLFAEIGGVAALGIGMGLLTAFTWVPAIRRWIPNGRVHPDHIGPWLDKLGTRMRRSPVPVVVAISLITVAALIGASTLRIESGSSENEFPQDDPVILLQQRIEDEYGAFQRAYIVFEGDIADPTTLRAMYEIQQEASNLPLYLDDSSVIDLLLADAKTDEGSVDILQQIVYGQAPIGPSDEELLPTTRDDAIDRLNELFQDPLWRTIAPFTVSRDYNLAVVAIKISPWESQEQLLELRDGLQQLATVSETDEASISAAGSPANRAAIVEQTINHVLIATLGTATTVGAVLLVAWRKQPSGPKIALAAVGMVLLASVWLLGAVAGLDLWYEITGSSNNAALNNMFLLAFAITVAVGVDDLVHIAGRHWEGGSGLRDAGRSITGTSLTTFVAFAVLAGVYFLQSKNLAILTAIGVASVYCLSIVTATFLLPKDAD